MFEICEEVISLIINDNKGREVFNIDLTNSLHTQLREVNTSTDLIEFLAKIAAGPPIDPR